MLLQISRDSNLDPESVLTSLGYAVASEIPSKSNATTLTLGIPENSI